MRRFIRFWKQPRLVFTFLSVLGLIFVSWVGGAASIYFRLPCSEVLELSFIGFESWRDRGKGPIYGSLPPKGVTVDKADKTFDGFTLITSVYGASAQLVDMRGNVVHEWSKPFSQVWPHAPHVCDQLGDERIHWFRCHLYPNGDLLAIYQCDQDSPHGYGLVKLDKASNVLWSYAGNVHHDLDLAEDGKIYALAHQNAVRQPPGMDFIPIPYISDYLVVLSPDGEELQKVSFFEAFHNSEYEQMLSLLAEQPLRNGRRRRDSALRTTAAIGNEGDVLHSNSVKVLGRDVAAKVTQFEPGQVLVSFRGIDTVAVLDIRSRSIVWATQGMWRAQHDAEFLDNGNLLLYDNAGSYRGSRLLECKLSNQSICWSYTEEDSTRFRATARGVKQRLPNGNTLMVDPDNGRILEVTHAKELVWLYAFEQSIGAEMAVKLTGARRYAPSKIEFLKRDCKARL